MSNLNSSSAHVMHESASDQLVLRCENLAKTYSEGSIRTDVLRAVNFELKRGETVAIIGASGAGKSTLLHLLGGLDVPSDGQVWVEGQMMSGLNDAKRGLLRNRAMGFIYQFHHLLPEFTALENVAMPLLIRGVEQAHAFAEAEALLQRVGLASRSHHKPGELSGGERQRAAVARALVTKPACVLGDEPTGNLDAAIALQVYELMVELNRDIGTALLLVTHDRALAAKMSRTLVLRDGGLFAA